MLVEILRKKLKKTQNYFFCEELPIILIKYRDTIFWSPQKKKTQNKLFVCEELACIFSAQLLKLFQILVVDDEI